MSVSTTSWTPALAPLAHQLAAAAATSTDVACVIGSTDDARGEPEVVYRGAVSDPIADALVGFVAPQLWSIVGVAAAAVARSGETETDIGVAVLVHRGGSSLAAVHPLGGAPWVCEPADAGRLADLCHRALGLATPSPAAGPSTLWAALWLDRIIAAAAADPARAQRWTSVAALHPLAAPGWVATLGADPVDLAAVVEDHPLSHVGWEALRADAAAGRDHAHSGVSCSEAAWFDSGSFARWALAAHGSAQELLATCAELVPIAVMSRIRRVLAITAPDALPAPR